ncbi:unnamed protein product [Clavelina lepadiformis]|uniref:Sulfotransferase family protein n=1 Tax=Clavelina lepadiformis TaxID=159417 RepID=A0ABP0H314_CLALP
MKVIVASFSKTGTKTLCAALNVLGYKVYDAVEHFWYHGNDWIKILTTGGTVEDFKRMYKDVDVVTDAPACNFWEEISEAFPDAKIVLTLRDEESWWRSLQKQFERMNADVSFKISHYVPYFSTYRYYKAICELSFLEEISND